MSAQFLPMRSGAKPRRSSEHSMSTHASWSVPFYSKAENIFSSMCSSVSFKLLLIEHPQRSDVCFIRVQAVCPTSQHVSYFCREHVSFITHTVLVARCPVLFIEQKQSNGVSLSIIFVLVLSHLFLSVTHQATVAKRVMLGLHTVTMQKSNVLARRPFFVFWFMAQIARFVVRVN